MRRAFGLREDWQPPAWLDEPPSRLVKSHPMHPDAQPPPSPPAPPAIPPTPRPGAVVPAAPPAARSSTARLLPHTPAEDEGVVSWATVVASLRNWWAGVVERSPAWAVSLAVHAVILLAMACWILRHESPPRLHLDMVFGTGPTDGGGDEGGGAPAIVVAEPDPTPPQPEAAAVDPEPVTLPLPPDPTGTLSATDTPAAQPAVPFADVTAGLLAGRGAGMKEGLLRGFGGTEETEAAVALALEWLVRQQGKKDGLWSLTGPYNDGGSQENQLAATAMALLSLQGAGNTTSSGPYKGVVAKGWRALLSKQLPEGNFDVGPLPMLHSLYSHAQATIALCELRAMTDDPAFEEPARRAVRYALAAQGPNGGWKYEPGKNGDMSVTGWYVMALKSAQMAGVDLPPETLTRVNTFLDSMAVENGSRYGYYRHSPVKPAGSVTAAVTAEGLLCRLHLGWGREDPRLVAGLEWLLAEHPLDYENNKDVYAWYYITQVMHQAQGSQWKRWNEQLREKLPKNQVLKGRERGSWDPALDRWGPFGGRLFVTCMSACSLEVYYRYLPLYGAVPTAEREPQR